MTEPLPSRYRDCEWCGESFQPRTSLGRFCAQKCRQAAFLSERPGYDAASQRRYRARHPGRRSAYNKAYRARPDVKERERERDRRRYAANPAPMKAYQRARRDGFVIGHTDQEWQELKALYEHRCAYCRKRRTLTKDHVVPVSKGDPATVDRIDNIAPACKPCNSSKNAKPWRPHPLQVRLVP